MRLLLEFVSALLLTMMQVYAWYKISNYKNNIIIDLKLIVIVLLSSIYSIISLNYINELIKPIIIFTLATICCKNMLNESFRNSFIIVFCQYLLVIIFEAIMAIIFLLLFNGNIDSILNNYLLSLIADICMCLFNYLILKTRIPSKVYKNIISHANNLKKSQIFIFLMIALICSLTVFAMTYFNKNIYISMIINIIITVVYSIIVIIIIKTKDNFISISSKYNMSLDVLQAQESIIDDYRILNHENNNNLMTIKSMSNESNVKRYINTLLKQHDKIKSKIINETLKLPQGGIRGLIYNKLLFMQDHNISYYLNVDKKINYRTLENIGDENTVDICQVLGVIIDNAIDESNNIEDNNYINIDLHLSNNVIIFSISNRYDGKKLNSNLKTTKGYGHGYGLKLVKKIIDGNDILEINKEITKELFIQKLYIKL